MNILSRIKERWASKVLETAGERLDVAGVPRLQMGRPYSLEERIEVLVTLVRNGWAFPSSSPTGTATTLILQADNALLRKNEVAAVALYKEAGLMMVEKILDGSVPARRLDQTIVAAMSACRKGGIPGRGIAVYLNCRRRGVEANEEMAAEFRLCKQDLQIRITEEDIADKKDVLKILKMMDPARVLYGTGLSVMQMRDGRDLRWSQILIILEVA